MKKNGKSLIERVKSAESRERFARNQMKKAYEGRRRANAISDGAMIWVTVLASMLGDTVHIPKSLFDQYKTRKYVVKVNDDGSMDMVLENMVDPSEVDMPETGSTDGSSSDTP